MRHRGPHPRRPALSLVIIGVHYDVLLTSSTEKGKFVHEIGKSLLDVQRITVSFNNNSYPVSQTSLAALT